ncbi:MAG: HIT family protein [Mesorhizobium sp.]|nr:HIT family protein [Mesorhizobium sp.]
MAPGNQAGFSLDARIAGDSRPVVTLGLCELRVQDDARWPWLVLVPQRAGITEMHDLTPLDQAMLTFEIALVAKALKQTSSCHKINIAALGNVVPQLHVHIVARNPGDAGWPGPVFGLGTREPWEPAALDAFVETLKTQL